MFLFVLAFQSDNYWCFLFKIVSICRRLGQLISLFPNSELCKKYSDPHQQCSAVVRSLHPGSAASLGCTTSPEVSILGLCLGPGRHHDVALVSPGLPGPEETATDSQPGLGTAGPAASAECRHCLGSEL